MLKTVLLTLYTAATLVLVGMGYVFEEPYGNREVYLAVLCAIYLGLIGVKILYKRGTLITVVLSFLCAVSLIVIELNSKYAVNYFFHTLYLLLIFFTIVHIQTKYSVVLAGFMTLLSFIKFGELIYITPTFNNIALMVFFGSFQILIVVVGVFLKVYQEETRKQKVLYSELLEAHDQLKAYSAEIKELSKMEARTKIARDLHDTLGHDMTGLIMQMEMASGFIDDGMTKEGQDLLEASKKSARESLVKVREIVDTLKNNSDSDTMENSIKELVDTFAERTGCTIHFSEKGHKVLRPGVNLVLFRIVQESLTNALRHGEATIIYVSLIYQDDRVTFIIEDNGKGCDLVEEGNGLKGMRERLIEIGGHLTYKSENGFMIKGHVPMREE